MRTHNVVIMPSQPCWVSEGLEVRVGCLIPCRSGLAGPRPWVRPNWASWWAAFHSVLKWKVEPLGWRHPRRESNTDSSKSASRTAARSAGIRGCVGGVCSEGLAVWWQRTAWGDGGTLVKRRGVGFTSFIYSDFSNFEMCQRNMGKNLNKIKTQNPF